MIACFARQTRASDTVFQMRINTQDGENAQIRRDAYFFSSCVTVVAVVVPDINMHLNCAFKNRGLASRGQTCGVQPLVDIYEIRSYPRLGGEHRRAHQSRR